MIEVLHVLCCTPHVQHIIHYAVHHMIPYHILCCTSHDSMIHIMSIDMIHIMSIDMICIMSIDMIHIMSYRHESIDNLAVTIWLVGTIWLMPYYMRYYMSHDYIMFVDNLAVTIWLIGIYMYICVCIMLDYCTYVYMYVWCVYNAWLLYICMHVCMMCV